MTASSWNIIGLTISLTGVLLLFRYGMPYKVRTGGDSFLTLEQEDKDAVALEKRYAVLGWIGVALICAGTAGQIIGNLV